MDPRKLSELLRASIDPNQRQLAEEQLNEVRYLSTKFYQYNSRSFRSPCARILKLIKFSNIIFI